MGANATLDGVKTAMNNVAAYINHVSPGAVIFYPQIGCGIGGLDWQNVAPIMDSAFDQFTHFMVEYV
jgi:O-acetyl-ADP-ribose deacetylase (regulator of RNase III)